MDLIREAVRPFPKAGMFELAERGYGSVFHQLVGCMLSIRTRDETSVPAAFRLFELAPTPGDIVRMPLAELDTAIKACAFHAAKAAQIQKIARAAVERYNGDLPCSFEVLTSFPGVGPKCANLALGISCGHARIAVDVHVHRIVNRLGYVAAPTPESTMLALEACLPERYHVEINALLVPFGKNICTARSPKCASCPVERICERIGV